MKTLILVLLLTLSAGLTLNCQAQNPQTAPVGTEVVNSSYEASPAPVDEKAGFFGRIWGKLSSEALYGAIGLIGGIFAKKGWIATFKKWLGYGVTITHSLAHVLDKTSNGLAILNNAIEDNGKLKENSLPEILAAKKAFTVELNDALITIKPKHNA